MEVSHVAGRTRDLAVNQNVDTLRACHVMRSARSGLGSESTAARVHIVKSTSPYIVDNTKVSPAFSK